MTAPGWLVALLAWACVLHRRPWRRRHPLPLSQSSRATPELKRVYHAYLDNQAKKP